MATQILSSPVLPPIFPRQNINRGVQQGGRNQQDQLFALLSFMSQQQRQQDTLDFRRRDQDERERRNKAEERIQEAELVRGDTRTRMLSAQSKIDRAIKKEQGRAFREEVQKPYDDAYERVFSTLRSNMKTLNTKSTADEVDVAVRRLDSIVFKELSRGGFYAHGAITAGRDMYIRILGKVPGPEDNSVLQSFASKLDEKIYRTKIVPRLALPQFAPTSDEFRPTHESIIEQGAVRKSKITDIALRPSPTDAIGQRNAQKDIRTAEKISFDRSPLTVPVSSVSSDDQEAVGFSRGLSIEPTKPKSTFEESTRELQSELLIPGEGEDRLFNFLGRELSARAVGVPNVALQAGKGLGNILNPRLSSFQNPFGGLANKPAGSFGQVLEDLQRMEETQTLSGIAAESDSITQRGTPPMRIGEGFLPAPQMGVQEDFLEQFLREAQGLPSEQNEIEKLFSSIPR